MRIAVLLLVGASTLLSCATPAPVVREVRVRPDRRLMRENRALRREVRALREELAQARSISTTESADRRRDSEAQSAVVSGLGARIRELTESIEKLERSVRPAEPPAVAPVTRRRGPFGKLRVGAVPAQSPTPPEPRDRMDAPEPSRERRDLLDPFTKAAPPSAVP